MNSTLCFVIFYDMRRLFEQAPLLLTDLARKTQSLLKRCVRRLVLQECIDLRLIARCEFDLAASLLDPCGVHADLVQQRTHRLIQAHAR